MADGRKTTSNKTHYDVQIVDDDVMTCLGQHTNRIITSDGGVEAADPTQHPVGLCSSSPVGLDSS
jgi:hypothetical protein